MHAKPEDHRTAVLFLSPSKHAEGATKHHFEEDVKPQCFFWKAVNRGLCILSVWDSGELFWINNSARLLQCCTKRIFFLPKNGISVEAKLFETGSLCCLHEMNYFILPSTFAKHRRVSLAFLSLPCQIV